MAEPYKRGYDSGIAGTWSAIGGEQRSVPFEASGVVEPGLALSFTADGKVTTTGSASLTFAGIGLVNPRITQRDNNAFADGESVSVANVGNLWCNLTGADASVVGGAVYRVLATGAITAVANTNTGVGQTALIPNARFESATAVGELADVHFG